MLSQESPLKIPPFRELDMYKNGSIYLGLLTDCRYQLVLKTLPPPVPLRPPAARPCRSRCKRRVR